MISFNNFFKALGLDHPEVIIFFIHIHFDKIIGTEVFCLL